MPGEDSNNNNIPSITTDVPPALSRSPSSGLLSRTNAHGPPSPSTSDAGSIPPSPTLSSHSVTPYKSVVQLRDNNPDQKSGLTSLGLLNPKTHSRKASNATSMTDAESYLREIKSLNVGTEGEDKDEKKKKGKGKSGDDEEPTQSDRQLELAQDEATDPTPFDFKPYQLAHMLDPKSIETLVSMGGIQGLLRGLGTDAEHGLSTADASTRNGNRPGAGLGVSHPRNSEKSHHSMKPPEIVLMEPSGNIGTPIDDRSAFSASFNDRKRVYGTNVLPTRISKTLLQLMWAAMKDRALILLMISVFGSLALGLFGTHGANDKPPIDWVERVAIVTAIAIYVIVGSLNDWHKERQFKALNERKEERGVKVIRDGLEKVVDVQEVVVGDIALLAPGEIVPVDGIFISGHNIKCNELGTTGESNTIKKASYDNVLQIYHDAELQGKDVDAGHTDCFMISGSKIIDGVGKYVVVAVGTRSFNGRIMMAFCSDTENIPLQLKLNCLAELIAKIGSIAGLTLFMTLMIKFFVQRGKGVPVLYPSENGIVLIIALIVVAVPEGLPLVVTLALAFATNRMTYENLLVRVLGSCESMANASVICIDKTGMLTQTSMTVVAGSVGIHGKFVRLLGENTEQTNADEIEKSGSGTNAARKHYQGFSIDQSQLNTVLSPELRDLFNEAIAINSTAFQDVDPKSGEIIFVGNKTETALLQFAKELNWRDFKETRDAANIIQIIPFSSDRKSMGVVVKLPNGEYRVYFKGASGILAEKSTSHVVVHQDGKYPNGIESHPIDELSKENINRTLDFYAKQTLTTIALCYREFSSWPPTGMRLDGQGDVCFEDLSQNLTLISITGIEDPLRDGVRDAVLKCQRAGVDVKMCTGDNLLTARSISTQCGIFTPGGIAMEGPIFRELTQLEMVTVVPRLQVLARSSPEDKRILVETLKMIGEVVAVTGDEANDDPALKIANVSVSMGIAGMGVAKEPSDIIIMDDNFSSIVKAIMWGRCVNDSVRKFLQFQISTNITAVIITFVTAVASDEGMPVLSAVQLLWITIIMDTFAALALATDPATEKLLDRKPEKKTTPLFSAEMYRMILMQSAYQIAAILVFHFLGLQILGLDHTDHNILVVKTIVFNAFVFAQIFNSVNCRRLDSHLNIIEGIFKNRFFIGITLLEIVVQILIVLFGGAAFQVTKIGVHEWGISVAVGAVSIPWGAVIRLMPVRFFEKFFKVIRLMNEPEILPTVQPDSDCPGAMNCDNLKTFSSIRGGRTSLVIKSRSRSLNQDKQSTISPVLAIMLIMLIGSMAASKAYKTGGSLPDPAQHHPSQVIRRPFPG